MFAQVPEIERILSQYQPICGKDFEAYRNHVYRVYYLTVPYVAKGLPMRLVAIATAFHDIGIWTNRTFDYLQPSEMLAQQYAQSVGLDAVATATVVQLIGEHHKITSSGNPLSNAFRLADWFDLTFGIIGKAQDRKMVKALGKQYPTLGFHRLLVRLFLKRFMRHPFSPLPMFKW